MKYTVIGFYPEQSDGEREREGLDYFVEWVEAATVQDAWNEAVGLYEERQAAWPVAIFKGQHLDQMFDGLVAGGPSAERRLHHDCQASADYRGRHRARGVRR